MIHRIRIAVLDDYQGLAQRFQKWERIPGEIAVQVFRRQMYGDELIKELMQFDVVVLIRERTPMASETLQQLPNLKLIVTTGPRNSMIDVRSANAYGITVCGTRHSMTSTIEYVWALIFACFRQTERANQLVRDGAWQTELDLGRTLSGRRLGIVGLGVIGLEVARIAKAFHMDVAAWSENLTCDDARAADVKFVDKRTLFTCADVVSLHLRESPRTLRIVGRREFCQMKPSAYLINTSRGSLVDTDALVAALDQKRIAGAALDVFEGEPLAAAHPLCSLPNVLLSPHAAALTEEHVAAWFLDISEDIAAWMAGYPCRVLNSDGDSALPRLP